MRFGRTALHAARCVLGWDQAHTQTTAAEQRALVRWATNSRRAVEIGVFEGANTARIAAALAPGGRLFAIDPFLPGRLGISWGQLIARAHIRREGVADRVEFVQGFSWEATTLIEGEFDFIFFDGDHSLAGVERDWHDWSSRVRRGGVVALHDTQSHPDRPGVSTSGSYRYFHSDIAQDARFDIVDVVDTLSVLRRTSHHDPEVHGSAVDSTSLPSTPVTGA